MTLITSTVAACLMLVPSMMPDVVVLRTGETVRGQIVREERGWIGVATDRGLVWSTTAEVRSLKRDKTADTDAGSDADIAQAAVPAQDDSDAPSVAADSQSSAAREYEHIRRLLADKDCAQRARATAWIVETWPRWRGVAVITLLDGAEPARLDVVRVLRQKRLRGSRDLLDTALRDGSQTVRLAALRAVRRRNERSFEPRVIAMLQTEPKRAARHEAIRTLEEIGGRDSLPSLLSAMQGDSSEGLRRRCRRALRRILGEDHGDDVDAWSKACEKAMFEGRKVRGDE